MKVVAFIVSFIMLGLSCLPCADMKLLANDSGFSTEITQTSTDQEDEHQDICNPFCTCSCCGTTPTSPKSTTVTLELPKYISSYEDSYTSSSLRSISLPIWQPPQLIA